MICITARGPDLNSPIDPRFGRAQYFLVFDPKDMRVEAIKNPNTEAAQGVGIKSGQLLTSKGVKILLTGHVGPKAEQVLRSAGIQIISGVSGTAKSVYDDFVNQVSDVS
jgi:predicted Fe-Mo cluster-binding NifX family protein